MRSEFKRILFFFTGILFLFSCGKDKVIIPSDAGYSYFPLSIGHSITYEADSIIYYTDAQDSLHEDKTNFLIRDVITSTFYDNSNRLTYIFERFKKQNDSASWQPFKVCTANLLPDALHWKEDNYTYVNLTFPPAADKHWNGNSYNILGEGIFTYTSVDIPYNYKTLSADSSLSVLQKDNDNNIEKDYMKEKYAKHIGLIYKEVIHREKDFFNFGKIKSGYEFRMKAISFSN